MRWGARKNRDPEHHFQASLVRWFRELVPPHKAIIISIPNGGKRSKAAAGKAKAEGAYAGAFDLLIILPEGRCHWVEIKRPFEILPDGTKRDRGRMSNDQIRFGRALDGFGHSWDEVWDATQFADVVKRLGLIGQ